MLQQTIKQDRKRNNRNKENQRQKVKIGSKINKKALPWKQHSLSSQTDKEWGLRRIHALRAYQAGK